MRLLVTGERANTPDGAFNPTFQRHVAAYRGLASRLPTDGTTLDLGCGTGHSAAELAPRTTVGVDVAAEPLAGQDRETRVADMRALPAEWDRRFAGVLCVHAIEHVDRAETAIAEVARVLADDGVAILVTPNRLTFARPDEIVDPYHEVEYDPREFADLVRTGFAEVELLGLHGSARYLRFQAGEKARMERLLGLDRLGLRHRLPRVVMRLLYDLALTLGRRRAVPEVAAMSAEDFRISAEDLDGCLDVVAVCRGPRRPVGLTTAAAAPGARAGDG